jgi:tetratricopeptide (TPR) repeat protein
MSSYNPYFILRPVSPISALPRDILSHAETIRSANAWATLGFSLGLDSDGIPSIDSSRGYFFCQVFDNDPVTVEAIRTEKKAERDPLLVFEYILAGCVFSDFVELSEDVKAFCRGNLLRVNGKPAEALPLLERAFKLNPDEVRYAEIYFALRLSLGDLSSIEDEFTCFERNIDSIIHSGRFEEWMKALITAGEFSRAKQIILRTEAAISRLADGKVTARFYSQSKPEYYAYKREQFAKTANRLLTRIQKLEAT